MDVCAVILAGGTGTRFWPWSDNLMPKQFLPIADPRLTLLQQARERVVPLVGDRILVLTNEEYVPVVRTQLPEVPKENIIGEPVLRDTAAAIGLGAALAERLWPGVVQALFPADHSIGIPERFIEILHHAAQFAEATEKLYTIGIEPAYPTEAYGYLERGDSLESSKDIGHFRLNSYVEKPDIVTAERYVNGGRHDWNAGIFVWKSGVVWEALERRLPLHAQHLPEAAKAFGTSEFDEKLRDAFLQLPKISIDFGMMQAEAAAGNVHMVAGDFPWSDLGGWDAFSRTLTPTNTETVFTGMPTIGTAKRGTNAGHLCTRNKKTKTNRCPWAKRSRWNPPAIWCSTIAGDIEWRLSVWMISPWSIRIPPHWLRSAMPPGSSNPW